MTVLLVFVSLLLTPASFAGADGNPQGGHSAADLAKLKRLVEATGLSARPQGNGFLVEIPGAEGRKWVALTGLSGPYVVGFTAVAQTPKDFTVSVESLRALLQINETVSFSSVALSGSGTVLVSTAGLLRLADGEELKARLEHLARAAERVRDALRPYVASK